MESSLERSRSLAKTLVEETLRQKKLVGENLQLRSSVRNLLGQQCRAIAKLLGTVTDKEYCFSPSSNGTQLSRVEAALRDISRALIEAQEQERARIARELHDNISQRLALLTVEIEKSRQDLIGASASEVDHRMGELKQQVAEIATDIHTMAHDLHSSSLEYLGFVPAVRKLAAELGKRQGIQIEIKTDSVPVALPAEISLCLFRIVQEALHNAARHSGAKRVEVRLRKTSDQIHLTLSDSGQGFDVAAIASGQGLGLASMRERIRLMNGKILIQSKRAVGTCIQAWVPLQTDVVPRAANECTQDRVD